MDEEKYIIPAKKVKVYKYETDAKKQYTEEEAREVFEEIYDFLVANKSISFTTELMHALQEACIIKARTYRYLTENRYPLELSSLKKDIDDICEHRKCKDKNMHAGITAMSLKNKHGWKDKTEQETTVKYENFLDELQEGE